MRTNQIHPKILHTIETMICNYDLSYQFYGEFCNYINFHASTDIPTMGVNVSKAGMNFYFNNEFVDSHNQEEINFIVIHEILHLLYNHPARSANYNHQLANVAQDMIINYIIDVDFSKKFCHKPDGLLYLPVEYKKLVDENEAKLYFEDLYNWLIEQKEEYEEEKKANGQGGQGNGQPAEDGQDADGNGDSDSDNGSGKDNGNGSGQADPNSPDENGMYPNGKKSKFSKPLRDLFDKMKQNPDMELTIDKHMKNEVDNDYAKEVVAQIAEGLKARGLGKGNVESVLGKVQRRKKDHLKEIKRSINTLKGNSGYRTINRPNILSIEGVKGKKKTGKGLNVILDTSGSMGGTFEKILSYVFQKNIIINLIQVDDGVQSFTTIANEKEFKKLKISGYGGTCLQPGIEYIKGEKDLRGFNLLILTDGYCDTLDFSSIPGCKKVLIISNGVKVPIASGNKMPLKQMVVEN